MSVLEAARERYWAVTDEVFKRLASGSSEDVLALLELVGDIANGCDYVDDESVEQFAQAKAAWTASHVFTDAELRARDERIINATLTWWYSDDRPLGQSVPQGLDAIIAAAEVTS